MIKWLFLVPLIQAIPQPFDVHGYAIGKDYGYGQLENGETVTLKDPCIGKYGLGGCQPIFPTIDIVVPAVTIQSESLTAIMKASVTLDAMTPEPSLDIASQAMRDIDALNAAIEPALTDFQPKLNPVLDSLPTFHPMEFSSYYTEPYKPTLPLKKKKNKKKRRKNKRLTVTA
jgi:hypothetical protein